MRLRRILSRTLLGTAMAAGLLGAVTLVTLPPLPRPAGPSAADPAISLDGTPRTPVHVVTGVVHVHTVRSDGTGTVDEVAAAAARAGVHFVVFTDHGDGTRAPLPAQYRSGVLCLDGVEISTEGGHYVALGLPRTPYRLAGEPRDVVDDVHRFGGFGIAAHPDSPKAELAWQGWDLPIGGIEWFNLDTEWRDESSARLLLALLHYSLRPASSMGALVRPDRPLLTRWDRLARTRRIAGVAAVDAHARVGADAGPGGGLRLRVPSYEASFHTARMAVELSAPLTRDPIADERAVLDALREARAYSWIEAVARAGRVEFDARRADGTGVAMGQFAGGSLEGLHLRAAAAAPAGSEIRVLCDGAIVASGPAPGPVWHAVHAPAPSACRAEVRARAGGDVVPWLVTNHIYGRAGDSTRASAQPVVAAAASLAEATWSGEREATSEAHTATPGTGEAREVSLHYRLGTGPRSGQYAALVAQPATVPADAMALRFTVRADRPMRVSAQLRQPDGGAHGWRWRRSIYADTAPREVVVPLADLRPIEPGQPARPALDRVHAVLFVVDTLNTRPGESGVVVVREVGFLRCGEQH